VLGQNEPSSLGLLDPSSREFRIIHKTAQGAFIPASLSVAWMPDGKSLLFVMAPVATNGVPMSLYRIPVSGGQAEKLFEADGIWQVRVHPDGRLVAIETRSYKFETLVADKLFAAARK
jgi:Tol biopolymer transport system component